MGTRVTGNPLRTLAAWSHAVVDFLYPPTCPVCYGRMGAEDSGVCFRCRAKMRIIPKWRCPVCGAAGVGAGPDAGKRCKLCPPSGASYQGVLSVVGYCEPVARAVHLFKYQRRREMGELIGRLMVEELAAPLAHLRRRLAIVAPVPLHLLRRVYRGFNQSDLLARPLAESAGITYDRTLLHRVRHTRRQALVKRERRAENVRNAFRLRTGALVDGKGVLLIDDVVTTGETINECARVLREAGAREVWVASFARAGMDRPEMDE